MVLSATVSLVREECSENPASLRRFVRCQQSQKPNPTRLAVIKAVIMSVRSINRASSCQADAVRFFAQIALGKRKSEGAVLS